MSLASNVHHIQQLMHKAAIASSRSPDSILLLAVSKQHSSSAIAELAALGVTHFGENYYQEAQQKIQQLQHLALHWHFIGSIQSNKVKGIAAHFEWVHSIDRLSIAQGLSRYRGSNLPPLNVCLQVNNAAKLHKSGVPTAETKRLAYAISQLPNITLRGLMTLPPPYQNHQQHYQIFRQLSILLQTLNTELGLTMDILSMGMSDDLVPAIKAGATIVRIGRALFGERTYE